MKKLLFSFILLLSPMMASADDGDTFSEKTVEGVLLKYTVISESEKTCMVGEEYQWPVFTSYARASRAPEANNSQISGDITIPEEANGYAVIHIEVMAFCQTAITSVFIPNSVKTIGGDAFAGCVNLKSVRLPEQLTRIEWETFSGCQSLTSIDIPEGVTSIGDYAFANCKQLKEITIPSSVEHFGGSVFKNTGFTSLPKLPESLTTIANSMFYACTQLTSIEIPKNITNIGECAFGRCPISEIEIPASVTHIGVAAFANCPNLTNITIPDNVTDIGFNAFLGCSNVKTVTLSNNLSSLSKGIFCDCASLESIVIPSGVKSIGKSAFEGCTSLRSINIPEGVEEITPRLFFNCSSLTQLIIPKSIVRITNEDEDGNHRTFVYGCNSLISIIVDEDNPVFDSRGHCNAIIETASNTLIAGCTATKIPEGITSIGSYAFAGLDNLTTITMPHSLKRIEGGAFNWSGLQEIDIPENVTFIGSYTISNCKQLKTVRSFINEPFEISENAFYGSTSAVTIYVPKGTVDKYKTTKGWAKVFKEIVELPAQDDYHPFIEEGKVWKLGGRGSANPVQLVEYYYFDGDTIINGKTCKQMMCQRYVNPDHPDYEALAKVPSLRNVGAWYEEDKKVYTYDTINKQFKIKYDFSLGDNETMLIENYPYVIGPKQTGGLKGFKGVYRDVMWYSNDADPAYCTTWLEGVGGIDGPITNIYLGKEYYAMFMMSCTVGDEVIYLNDEYEDGATPEGARKKRFDFTHTVKIQPKSRVKSEERLRAGDADASGMEQPLYGEYNDLQLGINLDPLDDAYQVRITNESGKVVYEKAVNAGSIVALSIDISAYAEGRYAVTVENSQESFTGEFDTQTTGISDATRLNDKEEMINDKTIYNLQGQRLSSLQKGLNIVNGQKIYVK